MKRVKFFQKQNVFKKNALSIGYLGLFSKYKFDLISFSLKRLMASHCCFPTNPATYLKLDYPEFFFQLHLSSCTSGDTKYLLPLWPQHTLFPMYIPESLLTFRT